MTTRKRQPSMLPPEARWWPTYLQSALNHVGREHLFIDHQQTSICSVQAVRVSDPQGQAGEQCLACRRMAAGGKVTIVDR